MNGPRRQVSSYHIEICNDVRSVPKINFSRPIHETDKTQNRAGLYIFADRVLYIHVQRHFRVWSFAVNGEKFQPHLTKHDL